MEVKKDNKWHDVGKDLFLGYTLSANTSIQIFVSTEGYNTTTVNRVYMGHGKPGKSWNL